MKDWIDFKKSFTQEQEDAIYQYFIDHSKIQPNGFLGVMFYIRDVNDFWKRVFARYNNDFKRYDKLEKQHNQDSRWINAQRRDAIKKSDICKMIDTSNNYWKKFILFLYRKTRKYLFGK